MALALSWCELYTALYVFKVTVHQDLGSSQVSAPQGTNNSGVMFGTAVILPFVLVESHHQGKPGHKLAKHFCQDFVASDRGKLHMELAEQGRLGCILIVVVDAQFLRRESFETIEVGRGDALHDQVEDGTLKRTASLEELPGFLDRGFGDEGAAVALSLQQSIAL